MAINRTSSHGEWSSRTAFILAATGSAVGLGNIWKFPYITGENGGGAFVLIYILCVMFIGIPIMLAEVYLGKRGRLNPIASIKYISEKENRSKNWRVIGLIGILAGILILSYYSVIAGWTMAYATRAAFGVINNIDAVGATLMFNNFVSDPERLLAWHTIFSIMTAIVVSKGVKSGLESAVIRLMPALLVLLLALVIFSAIEGDFVGGVEFMLYPDFSQVTWKTILIAMGQAFFSLSLGMGALMVYGSYLSSDISIPQTCVIVASLDTLVALLAGLAIFPIVISSGLEMTQGPGLIFQTLTVAFGAMPGGQLFGTLFFILLIFAAWTSSISLIEPMIIWMIEKYNLTRIQAATISSGLAWLLGIGTIISFNVGSEIKIFNMNIFETLDYLTSNILLPLGGIMITIYVSWLISKESINKELNIKSNILRYIWYFSARFIAPIAVIMVMLNALGFSIDGVL
ncbi:MAG: sodium-dependent transporter [Gammaproteobacteria bacterium]|jgi:neurotransmitter:Na+ symporter, NSS family|nr:sodium-dependent transporter [Gammaproteobacteria bacterium]MBT7814667.1 sodium-dependent transporter [Gammaproteobacteria bacterium]